MFKKFIKLSLCLSLGLLCVNHLPTEVYATDFAGNEDEYYELCQSEDLDKEGIQVCREFRDYLSKKQQNLDKQIASNQEKIDNLNTELDDVYVMIEDLSQKIADQEKKIAILDAEIERLQKSIDEKDQQIRDRMYVMQSSINSNVYLEFLMGASSIDDFFSRMSSIDDLTEYDHDLIRGFNEDKKLVEKNKKTVTDERDRLDEMRSQQDALAEKLSEQISQMTLEMEAAAQESAEYQAELDAISESIQAALEANGGIVDGPISSSGFSCPVQWGIVTSANWHYPSGGEHMGMDIGGRQGSELYAACDGLVIFMSTGCASDGGYLGNPCGGGAGNYMVMLSEMNGTTYALRYLHMTNNNYLGWTSGTFIPVSRGQVVGYMGHSGSSTGTHLHIEVFNLGPIGYTEATKRFAQYGTFFGMTWGMPSRCSVSGTPCREEASAMFGYSLYEEVGV